MGYKKNDERTNGYETFSISFKKTLICLNFY